MEKIIKKQKTFVQKRLFYSDQVPTDIIEKKRLESNYN